MCGIFGIISFNEELNIKPIVNAVDKLSHRGPDDEGFCIIKDNKLIAFKNNNTVKELSYLPNIQDMDKSLFVFAHKRLSIIDLSSAGHQPFIDEHNELCLIYNGEIYNFIELRKELENYGYNFKTHTDTEVLLYSLIHWGYDAFNKFNGMWAFALWNNKTKQLLLCRDRFGIKPLYYTITNKYIAFASEIKVLKKIPYITINPNINVINQYIKTSKQSYNEETFYKNIYELVPAHYLTFDYLTKNIKINKFWNYKPKIEKWNMTDALDKFSTLFIDAIKIRLRSDVLVGGLLSGGLDSSSILGTTLTNHLLTNPNFYTFSSVYKEDKFNEKPNIDIIINHFKQNHNHQYIYLDINYVQNNIKKLLIHIDEPIRSLSVLAQWCLYDFIKKNTKVTVLLNGQGADELFSGYTNAYYRLFAYLFYKFKFKQLLKEIILFTQNRHISFNLSFVKHLIYTLYNNFHRMFLLTKNFNTTQFQELTTTPLREYLKYDDRTSMAFGLESRTPFLDYRIVEFAYSLDYYFKIHNFSNKLILRKYGEKFLPNEIVNNKYKYGFPTPQEHWQKNELKKMFIEEFKQYNISQVSKYSPYNLINLQIITDYFDNKHNNWALIWRYYNTLLFLKYHF